MASDAEVAVREVLRDEWISGSRDTVLEASVENRQVSKLVLPRAYRLADLLHDDANGYGLNRELMADPSNYPMAREWALAFFRAGFAGIFYEPRNTLGRNRWAAALFDAAGAKDSTDSFPDAVSTKQMREAAAQAGVMITLTPTSSAGLTVVAP